MFNAHPGRTKNPGAGFTAGKTPLPALCCAWSIKTAGGLSPRGIWGAWRKRLTRAGERVGLRRLSPYSLRHQFASDQKQRGWNDDRLSQGAGSGVRPNSKTLRPQRARPGPWTVVCSRSARRWPYVKKPGRYRILHPHPCRPPEPATDLGMDLDVDDF